MSDNRFQTLKHKFYFLCIVDLRTRSVITIHIFPRKSIFFQKTNFVLTFRVSCLVPVHPSDFLLDQFVLCVWHCSWNRNRGDQKLVFAKQCRDRHDFICQKSPNLIKKLPLPEVFVSVALIATLIFVSPLRACRLVWRNVIDLAVSYSSMTELSIW